MKWEEALRHVCSQYMDQPLEWGVRDCCQFAATYVNARIGVDYAVDFNYDGKLSATRILAEHGGIRELVSAYLGDAKPSPEPGDLVMCALAISEGKSVETLGVTNGNYVWGIHPDTGLVRISLRGIVCAWAV